MSSNKNILVVSDETTQNANMRTHYGVTLPVRVWKEAAEALQYLENGQIDNVLAFRQSGRIRVKPMTITKKPIREPK